MKHPLWKSTFAALALGAALPAAAQVVLNPAVDQATAFYASDIQFLYGAGPTLQPQLAGFNLLQINGYGTGYTYDFCADFFQGNGDNWTFDSVTPGVSGFARETEIQALFSNALPTFSSMLNQYLADTGDWAPDPAFAADYDNLQGYAAGMQIALWELIHEQTASLSVDDEGAIPGSFRVDLDGAPNTQAALGGTFAEQFLTNIRNNTWTPQAGYNFYFADATGEEQDRIWIAAVPEPSAALLGAFGIFGLLRRRRA